MSMMRLISFSYKEYGSGWQLEKLQLRDLNLLVGKNATGKTRTLQALRNVVDCLNGAGHLYCEFELVFSDGGNTLSYQLNENSEQIEYEALYKGETRLLERSNGHCVFYGEPINPPEQVLAIGSRRDTKMYTEAGQILQWAEHMSYFIFSNVTSSERSNSPFVMDSGMSLYKMYERTPGIQEQVLLLLHKLGYDIDAVVIDTMESGRQRLFLKEAGVEYALGYTELSNGLFRVLSVLIYTLYSASLKNARCLMIDDLGEGLDYQRSNLLGNVVFDFCREHDIQLIATTNHSFLMDTVDVKYWTVLSRRGSYVTAISESTHPELFRQFKLMGLNNFDLFASDFICNHAGQSE